jgi:aryl-alcohol dehydrogenase-like predicted oxidoreductase
MRKTILGTTGRTVSRIGLGAMPLSLEGRPHRDSAKAVIRRAVELGVTLIDTADAYCMDQSEAGHNETLVAEALREMGADWSGNGSRSGREDASYVVVATKGGMIRPGGRWGRDGRPEKLRAACEASLRALGVERIDLYQFHAPDRRVPFAESVGALAELRAEGKVAGVGLSNVTAAQVREAREIVPVDSVQNRLGPWDVSARRSPIVELCRDEGITFLAYSPLGGSRRAKMLGTAPGLRKIAGRLGCTPEELVLAWILHRAPNIVPIPGASRVESIESSVRSESIELNEAHMHEIRRAFRGLPEVEGELARLANGVARRVKRLFGG